jgi:transposase
MSIKGFPKLRHHAAGIDIGSTNLHVSVDGETVKVFQSFTESIVELVKYLKDESVETVAMEATGVLWIPLYDMIEAAGIEVYLVNGSHVKNIPAQKSDILDSCWLQQTHSCGLLRASFIPNEEIRELRTYVRQRENLVELGAQNIQRMQKAFELMNIKLHNVISDIKGKSGLLIIESIL